MSKRVVVAGGSGFVGQHLTRALVESGFEVVVLSRSSSMVGGSGVRFVQWDGKAVGDWTGELEGATAVVNLCGASVSKKWTDSYRRALLSSRIEPTLAIAAGLRTVSGVKPVWVNASAVGIYGDTGDRSVSPSSPVGKGFLAELCAAWEDSCFGADLPGVRRVVLRLGVVLGKDGGAFPMLLKLALMGLGGAIGSGLQYMSWIHVQDLCRMVLRAIEGEDFGVFNACSPHPVTNSEFMSILREKVVRPPVPRVPAGLFRVGAGLLGMEAEVALSGQRVYPVVDANRRFVYEFDLLDCAIDDLVC